MIAPWFPLHLREYDNLDSFMGFPGSSNGKKKSGCNAGNPGSIPGLGRSLGGGTSKPLLYSCLENPMDRGAWWATPHGVVKDQTRLKQLSLSLATRLQGLPCTKQQLHSFHTLALVTCFTCLYLFVVAVLAKLRPTLWDPTDCSLPCSSVHRILQARILEWVTIPFSRDLPDPGIELASTTSQALAGRFFTTEPPGKPITPTVLNLFIFSLSEA